jgi:NADH-quinone oxidoreductase subunit M
LTDLNRREIALLVPILACIIWLGVYPKPVLSRMEASARNLVQQVEAKAARQSLTLGGGR